MSTVDEKLDRLIVIVEHLAEDVQDVKSDLKEFRYEMMQERTMLRNQIAAVTEALNSTIAENDAAHAEIIKVQEQNCIDITKLRAAI